MSVQPLTIAIVVGEVSGDALGARLIPALRRQFSSRDVQFIGTAGPAMAAEGVRSLFPLADIAVMGIVPVLKRLPLVLRRIRETADAVISARPDALVIIDSPDFTHRVASRVKAAHPNLPVIDYVSPTVWAWRPGRAPKMRAFIDHVLGLLPFEPEAYQRLEGPACTYVGHPLIERLHDLRRDTAEPAFVPDERTVLILPGSRRSEIARLMPVFAETVRRLAEANRGMRFVLPAVDHLQLDIARALQSWPVKPDLLRGESAKWQAFRSAHAALAASGTVTLELALARVPMVVAYKVGTLESLIRFLITVPSIVLPNLILCARPIPEFVQERCTAAALTDAMQGIITDGPVRTAQIQAFSDLDAHMSIGDDTPSERAARVIAEVMKIG